MKKILIITGFIAVGIAMVSCGDTRRRTGRAYMPDMAYSRAYETYASTEGLDSANIYYTARPVVGTIAIGDAFPYSLKNDSLGYIQSAGITNPLDSVAIDMKEAERLYLVNCGICHGAKLDGNGPLWNGGDGPYPAAPKNLLGDDMKALKAGTMFHVVTYGKGQMGSYASQLSTKQRWEVIAYVKSKQGGAPAASAPKADTVAAPK
jgi:mono/diheme cytochrome c family protein